MPGGGRRKKSFSFRTFKGNARKWLKKNIYSISVLKYFVKWKEVYYWYWRSQFSSSRKITSLCGFTCTVFVKNMECTIILVDYSSSTGCFPSFFQHPFLRLAKPLANLQPLILAAKEAQKGHWTNSYYAISLCL